MGHPVMIAATFCLSSRGKTLAISGSEVLKSKKAAEKVARSEWIRSGGNWRLKRSFSHAHTFSTTHKSTAASGAAPGQAGRRSIGLSTSLRTGRMTNADLNTGSICTGDIDSQNIVVFGAAQASMISNRSRTMPVLWSHASCGLNKFLKAWTNSSKSS
jgi:hypothetical protein